MELLFKKGQKYSRQDVGFVVFPNIGRPAGGMWDTGYVTIEEKNLIAFVNINIPGRTGHNFANEFNLEKNILIWFGKPKSHSKQPVMQKVINGDLTSHFFIRTEENDKFTYLGIGKVVQYEDKCETPHGDGLKMWVTFDEAHEILSYTLPSDDQTNVENENNFLASSQSFVIEKHLEEYIVKNFGNTKFGKNYDIVEQQYQTEVGRLDILAIKKDKSEYLVIELKRDLAASDVVSQITTYMGYIRQKVASSEQKVKGCIVATNIDKKLKYALGELPDIDFYRYEINFSLNKIDTNI